MEQKHPTPRRAARAAGTRRAEPDPRPQNRSRLEVVETYFDHDGRPTKREGLGAARIAWRYDGDGRQVDATLFGPDGAPVRGDPKTPRRRALEQA